MDEGTLSNHENYCDNYDVECKYCRNYFTKKHYQTHTKEECESITKKFNKLAK
jgi:hypothetical protein